jgi:uncharacterized cofD-like protein
MQKIVTIGGGTGQYQILRGLKNYDCEITAIVNVADNGGSSGKLMDEYGILPPGDARQCLLALADEEKGRILRELFNFRFPSGEFAGHSAGNLIIAAFTLMRGGSAEGIREAGRLLGIKGNVLPVTIDSTTLFASTSDGKVLKGQMEVSYPKEATRIKNVYCNPKAFAYCEAVRAIREADKIIVCPGDIYGSIIPNFIVKGIKEALSESKAEKIYVCNLFTKEGSEFFKASDFVREIEKYSEVKFDKIIINTKKPSDDVLKKYSLEKSRIVEDDMHDSKKIARGEFVSEYPWEKKTLLRHVPEKIARAIMSC